MFYVCYQSNGPKTLGKMWDLLCQAKHLFDADFLTMVHNSKVKDCSCWFNTKVAWLIFEARFELLNLVGMRNKGRFAGLQS